MSDRPLLGTPRKKTRISSFFVTSMLLTIGMILLVSIFVPLAPKTGTTVSPEPSPDTFNYLEVSLLNVSNVTCPNGPIIDENMCFPEYIATINMIPGYPPTDDFTLVGGPGIEVTGLTHGLTIRNLGILGVMFVGKNPIVNATMLNQVLILSPLPQATNLVYAGPASGAPDEPVFRALVDDDINNVSASKIIGVLPVEHGGTGSGATLIGDRVMVSYNNMIVEGPPLVDFNGTGGIIAAGDGIVIDLVTKKISVGTAKLILVILGDAVIT